MSKASSLEYPQIFWSVFVHLLGHKKYYKSHQEKQTIDFKINFAVKSSDKQPQGPIHWHTESWWCDTVWCMLCVNTVTHRGPLDLKCCQRQKTTWGERKGGSENKVSVRRRVKEWEGPRGAEEQLLSATPLRTSVHASGSSRRLTLQHSSCLEDKTPISTLTHLCFRCRSTLWDMLSPHQHT